MGEIEEEWRGWEAAGCERNTGGRLLWVVYI